MFYLKANDPILYNSRLLNFADRKNYLNILYDFYSMNKSGKFFYLITESNDPYFQTERFIVILKSQNQTL